MKIKYLIDEDFINYKKPSMFIGTSTCSGKCYKELGLSANICQNHELLTSPIVNIKDIDLCNRYMSNDLTSAIVFGGLEPFDQYEEIFNFINILRNQFHCNDDVVIYTGYTTNEIYQYIDELSKSFINIIVKYGRYIPNKENKFDKTLGIVLASDNQYAVKIS